MLELELLDVDVDVGFVEVLEPVGVESQYDFKISMVCRVLWDVAY